MRFKAAIPGESNLNDVVEALVFEFITQKLFKNNTESWNTPIFIVSTRHRFARSKSHEVEMLKLFGPLRLASARKGHDDPAPYLENISTWIPLSSIHRLFRKKQRIVELDLIRQR